MDWHLGLILGGLITGAAALFLIWRLYASTTRGNRRDRRDDRREERRDERRE